MNLKIKLKNESSLKNLSSAQKKESDKTDEANTFMDRSNLSGLPKNDYTSSNAKGDHSGIENILLDEKMSDISFSMNINEIIGSFEDKTEIQRMKEELSNKDQCIVELLKKIEQLDKAVN